MRSILFITIFALVLSSAFGAKLSARVPTKNVKAPKIDLCPTCVAFMNNAINDLLQIILNGGVIGSCSALCGQLPDQLLAVTCNLLCDYVGITEFVNFISYEDPDPIYLCQVMDLCPVVDGGKVNITQALVSPSAGPAGTKFAIVMRYTVISTTSTGTLAVQINPPDGFPMGDGEFTEPQTPGEYSIEWDLDSTPSESEAFSAGVYPIVVAVCAGDCSDSHPYGGVYAQANTQFKITGK